MTRLACRVARHDWITYHYTAPDGRTRYRVPLYCDRCRTEWPNYWIARGRRRRHLSNLIGALVIVLAVALVTFAVLALADDMLASTWGGLA